MKNIKISKSLPIEYLFIKLFKVNSSKTILFEKYFKIFNLKNFTILNNNLFNEIIIIIGNDISNKKLINIIKYLTQETYNFEIYLISFNRNINSINIKVYNTTWKSSEIVNKINYYPSIFRFFKDKLDIKKVFFNELNKKNGNKDLKKVFLKINNFYQLDLKLNKLLYLLCLFGNIDKIYYDFLYGIIYFSYKSISDISKLMNFKNKLIYNDIKINIILVKSIFKHNNNLIKSIEFSSNLNLYDKIFFKLNFNKPNNTIIILNINIKDSKIFKYYNFIKKFHTPLFLKFIDNEKNNTKILLVKFKNIMESINIIINLSNLWIGKNRIRICFLNSNNQL